MLVVGFHRHEMNARSRGAADQLRQSCHELRPRERANSIRQHHNPSNDYKMTERPQKLAASPRNITDLSTRKTYLIQRAPQKIEQGLTGFSWSLISVTDKQQCVNNQSAQKIVTFLCKQWRHSNERNDTRRKGNIVKWGHENCWGRERWKGWTLVIEQAGDESKHDDIFIFESLKSRVCLHTAIIVN